LASVSNFTNIAACLKYRQGGDLCCLYSRAAPLLLVKPYLLKLQETLQENNINADILSMDNYYKSRGNEEGEVNYDEPNAFDMPLFYQQLLDLENGLPIERPTFSFKVKDRLDTTVTVDPNEPKKISVMIVEGILALHEVDKIPVKDKLTAFVDTDWYLKYLIRRRPRDVEERDTEVHVTDSRELNGVRDSFFKYINPCRSKADFVIMNTFHSAKITPNCRDLENGIAEMMPAIKEKLGINNNQLEVVI
jgi:uridine kinase